MERGGVERALAVDATSRGFCYVVLEGRARLVDWGCSRQRLTNRGGAKRRIDLLIKRYRPDLVVLEARDGSRLGVRARELINMVGKRAIERGIRVVTVPRSQVAVALGNGTMTKWDVAETITARFPELTRRLPPRRRPWMSEDERINIFDAAALALAALDNS